MFSLEVEDAALPEKSDVDEQVFVAICLRVIVAITNYEQGENPGRTKLKTP